MKRKIIFKDTEELRDQFSVVHLFDYPASFEIDMPILSKEEVTFFTRILRKYSSYSGYDTGKIVSGISLSIYLCISLLSTAPYPTGNQFINCIFYTLLGALVGKIAGQVIYNFRIKGVINDIAAKVANRKRKIAVFSTPSRTKYFIKDKPMYASH